jgi:hypothetical protein
MVKPVSSVKEKIMYLTWDQVVEKLQEKGIPVRKGWDTWYGKLVLKNENKDWNGTIGNSVFYLSMHQEAGFCALHSRSKASSELVDALKEITGFSLVLSGKDPSSKFTKHILLLANTEEVKQSILDLWRTGNISLQ